MPIAFDADACVSELLEGDAIRKRTDLGASPSRTLMASEGRTARFFGELIYGDVRKKRALEAILAPDRPRPLAETRHKKPNCQERSS